VTGAELGVVLALLLTCLVALLLVQTARREAAAVRARAAEDVADLRADSRRRDDESRARVDEVRALEKDLVARRARLEAAEARHQDQVLSAAGAARLASEELARRQTEVERELESAAGLSREDALARLTDALRTQATRQAEATVRTAEASARRTADQTARRIVTAAVQRLSVPTSSAVAVTLVPLPSDDLRGRIIGREGRNIRTFEAVTGVNLLVDDDSSTVQLSSFDPERREVAHATLQMLFDDGRIHPQRIESAYALALAGSDDRAVAAGHDAAERAGVRRLPHDLVVVVGALRLRTSYGQDVLEHSVEAALVAAALAAELGADVEVARRAAFLHDIGKARSLTAGGTHAAAGADLLRDAGESAEVVNAVAAHHGEVAAETVEAVLVQAADAISAARPGARRDELERYVERMERLEGVAAAHHGVVRALALASGHELRVVVEPAAVPDADLPGLAREIARDIEAALSFPGEISITVVRELRAHATAG
jgi:ribonuclease Y